MGVLYTTVTASGHQPPDSPPPPPVYTPTVDRPPMSLEEERQRRKDEAQQVPGRTSVVAGPETSGSNITVAEIGVQLPANAFVNRYVVQVLCVAGLSCPQTPIYELKRGNSTISVSIPSGIILDEEIAPGEEGAFDFLKEVVP